MPGCMHMFVYVCGVCVWVERMVLSVCVSIRSPCGLSDTSSSEWFPDAAPSDLDSPAQVGLYTHVVKSHTSCMLGGTGSLSALSRGPHTRDGEAE